MNILINIFRKKKEFDPVIFGESLLHLKDFDEILRAIKKINLDEFKATSFEEKQFKKQWKTLSVKQKWEWYTCWMVGWFNNAVQWCYEIVSITCSRFKIR